jgi:hypothetical protein
MPIYQLNSVVKNGLSTLTDREPDIVQAIKQR